jgi:N-acetylglucosamine kinase-like BadF-type ATPase
MLDKNELTIIGIDGGGTHTRGALFKGGKIAAEMKSGTTRIGAVGVGESCERTLNVITELCKKAEIETSELDAVVVGLAGVWLDEEKKRSQSLIKTLARGQRITFNDLIVTSDAEIALEGAFKGGDGIILIVGTGSISLGKFGSELIRCGGWGIELDDEGSGAWIGREGLTAVVRALDGRGKETVLTKIICDLYPAIDIKLPRTIVKAYAERAFEYQMLTPSIMKSAESGDEVCMEIINRAANHLVELPLAIIRRSKKNKVKVALMGGIIDADTLLKKMIENKISQLTGLELVKPAGGAIDGALSMAYSMTEQDID